MGLGLSIVMTPRVGAKSRRSVDRRGADRHPGTILLVEDERLVRVTARYHLERDSYRVIEAGDSGTALALCRSHRVDLLLTDLALPGIDGSELARRVTAMQPRVAVVFMTAHPRDGLVCDWPTTPSPRSLQKPFDEQSLLETVRAALHD
jgi:two-component system, cell cycle sensor histidine kinase and response regulator CckA